MRMFPCSDLRESLGRRQLNFLRTLLFAGWNLAQLIVFFPKAWLAKILSAFALASMEGYCSKQILV